MNQEIDNLCHFLTKFPSKPYVIAISETRLKDKPLVNISLPDYDYVFLHNNSLTNAGGVSIYVSEIFHCKKLRFLASFSGCESLWLQLSCPENGINYVV